MNKKKLTIVVAALCALVLLGLILVLCLPDKPPVPPETVPPTTAPPPHKHTYTQKIDPPSCTDFGRTEYTCACGFTYFDNEQPATGHTWSQWEIVLEPTEEAEGLRERACSVCNAQEDSPVAKLPPAHKHSYTEKETLATCTAGGYTLYVCDCGDSYAGNETAPMGHSFTQYTPNGDATCTADGTKTADCDRCEASETVKDTGSATGHKYDKKVTQPTCTAVGYTDYTCACGDTYRDDELPATGHSWGKWLTTLEPTEETEGQRERECDACGAKETGLIAKLPPAHQHAYAETVTNPTCTATGYTVYTCACGDSYRGEEVSALGHSFTKYIGNDDATCTKDGTKTAKCDRCQVTQMVTDTGSAKGHSYAKQVIPAGCLTDGYAVYTCSCGQTYQADAVPALGHKWTAWTTVLEPTEEDEGLRQRRCPQCDEKQEEPIAKLPPVHKHSYTKTVTAPGCATVGYTIFSCACGDTYRANEVAALGHSFTKYTTDNNATCTMDGTQSAKCDRCDEIHTVPNPNSALEHSFGNWVITREPTNQTDGIQERTCTSCGAKEARSFHKQNLTYEEYMNLSAEEQQIYFESFATIEDYFAWFNAAKQAYEESKDKVDVSGGTLDIGDILGGGG